MKRVLLPILAYLLICSPLFAQKNHPGSSGYEQDDDPQNELKINLLAISFKTISFEYEKQVSRKTTVSIGFRGMPKSSLPFKNSFKNAISDTSTGNQLDNFKTGNVALIPSIRFYVGHRGAFHG